MKDSHKSCNLSSVVYMVWRVPRRRNDGSTIICSNPYRNKRTADQLCTSATPCVASFRERSESIRLWSTRVGP